MSDWARWGDVGDEDEEETQYEVIAINCYLDLVFADSALSDCMELAR